MCPQPRLAVIAVFGLTVASITEGNAALITFLNQEIVIPTSFAGVSLDLETGAVSNGIAGALGADANFFLGGAGISNDADETAAVPTWQPVRSGSGNSDPVVNLSFGTVVDGSSVTAADFGGSGGAISHFPPFVNGESGYLGFSLEIAGPTTAYGWMRVTLRDDNSVGVIHGWAYDDTGAGLAVGTIPEPSSGLLGLMGLGAIALRRRRR